MKRTERESAEYAHIMCGGNHEIGCVPAGNLSHPYPILLAENGSIRKADLSTYTNQYWFFPCLVAQSGGHALFSMLIWDSKLHTQICWTLKSRQGCSEFRESYSRYLSDRFTVIPFSILGLPHPITTLAMFHDVYCLSVSRLVLQIVWMTGA